MHFLRLVADDGANKLNLCSLINISTLAKKDKVIVYISHVRFNLYISVLIDKYILFAKKDKAVWHRYRNIEYIKSLFF